MSFTPGKTYKDMYEYHLPNGMRIILVPRPGIDVCTANITYHVGSAREGLGVTGATHFLEHLQFKGSKKFSGKEGMWKLEELGMYMNATTYLDRTNFFEVMQTKDLNEAIIREADRMFEPLLTEESLKSEMSVVRNELERGANNSFQLLHQAIVGQAFQSHPYHHATIGWKDDVENVSAAALRNFHDTFYIPNNSTYTIVGNFDPVEVKRLIWDAFKDVKAGPEPPKMYTQEEVQTGQRRITLQKPSNTSLMGIAFKSVKGLHPDAITLEVLAKLIASGPTSPVEPLRKSGVVHDVMPSWERMKDPYLFSVWVTTNNAAHQTMERAEAAVMELLQTYPKPSQKELDAAKASIEYGWKESMESTRGMASEINEAISRGDAFDVYNRFRVLRKVTADDIVRVAKATFNVDRSTVGWFLPGEQHELLPEPEYSPPKYSVAPSIDSLRAPSSTQIKLEEVTKTSETTAFTKYNSAKTHIRISLQSPSSTYNAYETMARHMLADLMTKGVKIKQQDFPEQKIQAFLDTNGIERHVSTSPYGINITVSIPSNDSKVVGRMISLLKSEMKNPTLNSDTFDYLQKKTGAELMGSSGNVNNMAGVLMSQALFEDGSCNYVHTSEELKTALFDLGHSSIVEEHQKLLNGTMKLSVLSSSDEILDMCKKLTTRENSYTPMVDHVLIKEPGKSATIDYKITGKTSCTIKWGHVIDKPSIATKIAIGALGNGFAGRLMKIVRDKLGLTYGVYARQTRQHGAHVFDVTATFAPANLERGIRESEKVMNEWKNGVTNEEIDIQKQMLIGSQVVSWDNPAVISATVHSCLLQNKSMATVDDFKKKVESVSYAAVRRALKTQLFPTRLKRVTVGTF